MANTSKAHKVHPQPCCHCWPAVSSSVLGTETALAVPGIYQSASAGGRDPSVLLAQPLTACIS